MNFIKTYFNWLTLIPGIIIIDLAFYIGGIFSKKVRNLYYESFIRPIIAYKELREMFGIDQ